MDHHALLALAFGKLDLILLCFYTCIFPPYIPDVGMALVQIPCDVLHSGGVSGQRRGLEKVNSKSFECGSTAEG